MRRYIVRGRVETEMETENIIEEEAGEDIKLETETDDNGEYVEVGEVETTLKIDILSYNYLSPYYTLLYWNACLVLLTLLEWISLALLLIKPEEGSYAL